MLLVWCRMARKRGFNGSIEIKVGDLIRPLPSNMIGTAEEKAAGMKKFGVGTVIEAKHTYPLQFWQLTVLWSDGVLRDGPSFAYERVTAPL